MLATCVIHDMIETFKIIAPTKLMHSLKTEMWVVIADAI